MEITQTDELDQQLGNRQQREVSLEARKAVEMHLLERQEKTATNRTQKTEAADGCSISSDVLRRVSNHIEFEFRVRVRVSSKLSNFMWIKTVELPN